MQILCLNVTYASGDGSLSFANEGKMNDKASPLDHLYLKNVLLKFVVAATQGHIEQASRISLCCLICVRPLQSLHESV